MRCTIRKASLRKNRVKNRGCRSFSNKRIIETKKTNSLSVKGSMVAPIFETRPNLRAIQPSKKSDNAAKKMAVSRISMLVFRKTRAKGILVKDMIVGRYCITLSSKLYVYIN